MSSSSSTSRIVPPDQHRVVLRAARQHLHRAANLFVAADHGVQLSGAREVGEIFAVLLKRAVRALGVLAVTRPEPRTSFSTLSTRSRVMPARLERLADAALVRASASSRCSELTYSSFSDFASSSARSNVVSSRCESVAPAFQP